MFTIDFDSFNEKFLSLPSEYQTIVLHLIQNMEHINISPKDIRYRRGFNIALKEHNLSINELADILQKRTYNNKPENSLSNDFVTLIEQRHVKKVPSPLRDGIASLIEQGHKGTSSIYFDMVCEFLEIDETFLIRESEYIYEHSQDIKWCFDTLSPTNQYAMYMFITELIGTKCINPLLTDITKTISNVGVSST